MTQYRLQNNLLPSSWDGVCACLPHRHLHSMPSCSPGAPEAPFGPGSPAEPFSPLGPTGPAGPGVPALPAAPGKPVAAEEMGTSLRPRGEPAACVVRPLAFLQHPTGRRHPTSTVLGPVVIQEMGVHIPSLQVRKQACRSWLRSQEPSDFPYRAPSPAPRPQCLQQQAASIYP